MSTIKVGVFFFCIFCLTLRAQDAQFGLAMPVTLSAEGLATHRLQTFDPKGSNLVGGFRANFYPSAKLGSRWFAYSAIQVNSVPYFYYDSYYPTRDVEAFLLQAFVGYTQSSTNQAFSFKAGKLPSAFGSYPLRYDDAANPLIDAPLMYGSYLGLAYDQLPCGVGDLLRQRSYRFVRFSCGGSTNLEYGVWPVSVYGIPGAEMDYSFHKFDARFQLTNSSPAAPESLRSDNQHLQWTAGGGYTIRQGFRIGISAYRGPFFDNELAGDLVPGKNVRDYPATAVGIDGRWAGGRWSANAEWARFQYDYPGFRISPVVYGGYFETKAVITPSFYGAFRASFLSYNHIEDALTRSSGPFQPNQQEYEFGLGFHVDHFQTLKLSYEWLKTAGLSGTHDNIVGIQFVTSIDSLSKGYK